MNRAELVTRRDAIAAAHGPWSAHDIDLGQGVSTLDKGLWQQWRVDFFRALIERHTEQRAIAGLRLIDLGCLEGLFAIEFARLGAETVGLEIRDVHVTKAKFARDVLKLDNCAIVRGDVRSIPHELGNFDVVLCAGVLHHLDFPDSIRFLRDIAKRARDLIVMDSHFASPHIETSVLPLSGMRPYQFGGRTFVGREWLEHEVGTTEAEKKNVPVWASIDNPKSVWLEERDVVAELYDAGFHPVARRFPSAEYERNNPDRPTLVFKRAR